MKILFLQDNLINESLALCELAGLLKSKGYKYNLLVQKEEKYFFKSIKDYKPTIIIIPISIIKPHWGLLIAKHIKTILPKTIILAGGTYPTFYPDIINLPYIDIVLFGEAENPIIKLLNKLKNNKHYSKIENLCVKINGKITKNQPGPLTNIENLPMPDREIFYKYKTARLFPLKIFSSGRGCPNYCSFCFNSTLKKMHDQSICFTRKKPVNKLLREIDYIIKNKYPLNHVHFFDDLFTFDKKWTLDFCKKYKNNYHIPFSINSKIEYLDEEIIVNLKAAGCKSIATGIESGNEKLRMLTMQKKTNNKKIIKISKIIKKHGIALTTFNMINIPGEKIENVFQTIKLNHLIKTDNPRIRFFVPIPNTQLFNYAKNNNLLAKDSKNNYFIKNKFNREYKNISHIFPFLVKFKFINNFIYKNSWLLKNIFLSPFWAIFDNFKLFFEKYFFNISFLSAIPYFWHTGGPKNKTNVYSSLI